MNISDINVQEEDSIDVVIFTCFVLYLHIGTMSFGVITGDLRFMYLHK